jgi:hypothetical protein
VVRYARSKRWPTTSDTPILDRQSPLPPPAGASIGAKRLLALWIALVLGTATVLRWWRPAWLWSIRPWVLTHLGPLAGAEGPLGIAKAALLAAAAVALAVVLHELAHLLAGLGAGFGFNQLRIARLQIDAPFRLSIYRGRGTGSGGWASLFPVRQNRLVVRALAMVAAGPVANLLSAAAVLAFVPSLGFFPMAFVIASLILGVVNLVPFRNRAVLSDGMRVLMLLRSRERAERWLALMKLGAELTAGVLPESFSPGFLAKAVAVRDASPDTVAAHALAFSSAFHRHQDDEAARALETCLEYSGYAAPILREALMSDAGVFQARRRKNADLAAQWLAAMPARTELPWLRARVEAAILEALGDREGALSKLDEVERAIRAEPNPLRRDVVSRLTQRWQSELRSA